MAYTKYFNKKTKTKDGTFDSKKEADEWFMLKIREQAGEISDLQRQVEFQLIPTIRTTAETLRRCSYIADFYYWDNARQSWVVQDTKGFKTDVYNLKKRLMLWLYPEIIFIESGKIQKIYKNTLELIK